MTSAKFRLVGCLIFLMLYGCARSSSTPEGLVEAAFDAIKTNERSVAVYRLAGSLPMSSS